jgi:hypothetical protein
MDLGPSQFLLAKTFGMTDGLFIVAIILLVVLSAFFSASETAFSSVNTLHIKTFAEEKDFWNPELKCKAYIIALGVNDLLNNKQEVGSIADICKEDYRKNANTFAGYYAAIVQRLKKIAPEAKFFFMTMPEENNRKELQILKNAHARLMYDFAEFFDNSYVLDFKKYAPVYNEAFKEKFYLNNHLNAAGYALTAKFVISYIDYIIRHNLNDFSEIALVNTPYKNYKSK